MGGFTAEQQWEPVNIGRGGGGYGGKGRGKGSAAAKAELTQAQRSGQAATESKLRIQANASSTGHGPMGTTAGASAKKLAEATEAQQTKRTGPELGKAIMQARTAKGLSQKQLATQVNAQASIVGQCEQGSAVYDAQLINKLERALGVKLPRPAKASAAPKPKASIYKQ